MATGFAYVPARGDGTTVIAPVAAHVHPSVMKEIEPLVCVCGEPYTADHLLAVEDYLSHYISTEDERPFLDDPYARDACA